MTKYTPGPWKVTDLSETIEHIGKCNHVKDSVGYFICSVDLIPNGDANARLIAAAPELLRACQWAQEYFSRMSYDEQPRFMDRLNKAVAQATGGES